MQSQPKRWESKSNKWKNPAIKWIEPQFHFRWRMRFRRTTKRFDSRWSTTSARNAAWPHRNWTSGARCWIESTQWWCHCYQWILLTQHVSRRWWRRIWSRHCQWMFFNLQRTDNDRLTVVISYHVFIYSSKICYYLQNGHTHTVTHSERAREKDISKQQWNW